jgi:hypothetical protein
MSVEEYRDVRGNKNVTIIVRAHNAKMVDAIVRTVGPNGVILRTKKQNGQSEVSFSFKPTLGVLNLFEGFILNADLPGGNLVTREIRQEGHLLASTTNNPENFPADPGDGSALGATEREFFVFKGSN